MMVKSSARNRFMPWVLVLLMLCSVVLLTLLASGAQASAPDPQEVYISNDNVPLVSGSSSAAGSSGYVIVAVYAAFVVLASVGVGYIITASERKRVDRNKA